MSIHLSTQFMPTPAKAGERIILGVGIVLLLTTAFALIDGRLPPAECPDEGELGAGEDCTSSGDSGWLIPTAAVVCFAVVLVSRISRNSGSELFGRTLPDETAAEMQERMGADNVDKHDDERLSDAWATMETKMLSSKHDEEE